MEQNNVQYKNLFKSSMVYLIAILCITSEVGFWEVTGAVIYWIMAIMMILAGTLMIAMSDKIDQEMIERLIRKSKGNFYTLLNPEIPYIVMAGLLLGITAFFPFKEGYPVTGTAFLLGYVYMLIGFYFFRKELKDRAKLYGYIN